MKLVTLTVLAMVLSSIAYANADTEVVAQFENFKKTYGRAYATQEEEAKRLGVFVKNMQKAAELAKRNPLAKFGVNEFADMTEAEFKVRHSAESFYKKMAEHRKTAKTVSGDAAVLKSVQQIDWRTKGAVTAVKNQGQCGSCWSFSTTGSIEGQWFLAGNTLVAVSEQELVSCDTTDDGCNGGLMDNAFSWLVSAKGGQITSEAQYPYVSGQGAVPACSMSGKTTAATINGHVDVTQSESAMAAWLGANGPMSIGVDASSWQTYMGGILTDCTSSQVDHGVLAVGFDLTYSTPYWIIKNSWGASWGEEGYIRVGYGSDQCLITTSPCSSTVSRSGPTPPAPPPGPTPPSPPSPPAPTPPSPSTGTFTQYTCPGSWCLSDCTSNTFQTGVCLQTTSGGSALASCGTNNLNLNIFSSSDCSGSYQTNQIPLNTCVEDTSGSYIYDTCNTAALMMINNNGTSVRVRKH